MNERVVLYFEKPDTSFLNVTHVTQVDFLWFPTTNLFVAFIANFLADQNVMSCVRGDLTPHFEHETLFGFSLWYMNLN